MARPKRDAKKTTCRQPRYLTPARHTIAKQSAAVLALGLGLTAGAPAEASIVYTDLGPAGHTFSNDILGFLDYPGDGNMFQIVHGGYSGFRYGYKYVNNVATTAYYFNNPINNSYGKAFIAVSPYYSTSLLNKGDQISGSLSWHNFGGLGQSVESYGNTYEFGYFLGKKGYVGLKFDPGDGAHYGWAQVSMPDDGMSVTLYGYAYETEVDTPINAGAGAVPLPSSLLLLGSGAAGLLAYRRRRRAA